MFILYFQENGETPLSQSDFERAIKNVNKSVSTDDLENFEKWMVEFGST